MASTITTASDTYGFVLANFPVNLITSQKKTGSQSTDAALDLIARKIHYTHIYVLLGSSDVKSL